MRGNFWAPLTPRSTPETACLRGPHRAPPLSVTPGYPTTVGTPPSCWLHHRIPCLGAMQTAMPLQGMGLEKTVALALAKSGQQLTDNYSTGNSFKPDFKPGLDGVPKGRPQASHPQDRTKVPSPH